MKVQVLYFGRLRDEAGRGEDELEGPFEGLNVSQFVAVLSDRLKNEGRSLRLEGVRFAMNEEFVHGHESLAGGEVIALIPPVCGG